MRSPRFRVRWTNAARWPGIARSRVPVWPTREPMGLMASALASRWGGARASASSISKDHQVRRRRAQASRRRVLCNPRGAFVRAGASGCIVNGDHPRRLGRRGHGLSRAERHEDLLMTIGPDRPINPAPVQQGSTSAPAAGMPVSARVSIKIKGMNAGQVRIWESARALAYMARVHCRNATWPVSDVDDPGQPGARAA